LDKAVIAKVKAASKAGTVTAATAKELGPEAGLARTAEAARSSGTTVPPGARAAAIGQTDALHADPAVRSFSRAPANNPLVGATDAEVSAAVDAPINSNAASTAPMTSLAATKSPAAKSAFQGTYSDVASRAPSSAPEAAAPVSPAESPAPQPPVEPPAATSAVGEPSPGGPVATARAGGSAANAVGTGLFLLGMGTSVSNENDLGKFAAIAIAAKVVGAGTVAFLTVFFHTDDREYSEVGGQLRQYK